MQTIISCLYVSQTDKNWKASCCKFNVLFIETVTSMLHKENNTFNSREYFVVRIEM